MGLPLLFIPFIALDSWLLMALPLMGVLLASSFNDPLSLSIRYTYLVVPGLFAGAVYWWSRHQELFEQRRLRRVWAGCIVLSLLLGLSSNPNNSLSLLIPDSISPGVTAHPRCSGTTRAQRWLPSTRSQRGQRECQHSTDSSFGCTAGADPLPVSRGLHRSCRG